VNSKEANQHKRVLIHAGASGVGSSAIQLAHLAGVKQIIVTAGSEEKLTFCKQLGSNEAINYKTDPDFSTTVKELTDGEGVHLLIDFVGQSYWNSNLNSLAVEGKMVMLGFLSGFTLPEGATIGAILRKRLQVCISVTMYRCLMLSMYQCIHMPVNVRGNVCVDVFVNVCVSEKVRVREWVCLRGRGGFLKGSCGCGCKRMNVCASLRLFCEILGWPCILKPTAMSLLSPTSIDVLSKKDRGKYVESPHPGVQGGLDTCSGELRWCGLRQWRGEADHQQGIFVHRGGRCAHLHGGESQPGQDRLERLPLNGKSALSYQSSSVCVCVCVCVCAERELGRLLFYRWESSIPPLSGARSPGRSSARDTRINHAAINAVLQLQQKKKQVKKQKQKTNKQTHPPHPPHPHTTSTDLHKQEDGKRNRMTNNNNVIGEERTLENMLQVKRTKQRAFPV
jgi:Zinc-binding dehydrogenase